MIIRSNTCIELLQEDWPEVLNDVILKLIMFKANALRKESRGKGTEESYNLIEP